MSTATLTALTLAAGAVLVSSLVATGLIMRRISGRLAALHDVLSSISDATEPLPSRVGGIAGNVRDLRDGSTELRRVVAERADIHQLATGRR